MKYASQEKGRDEIEPFRRRRAMKISQIGEGS
jgi:hypothetical protein